MYLKMVLPLMVIACCQSNIWNDIVPLKSTRADVEKILGKPMPHSIAKHAASYNTKDGRVFVLYSTGLCNVNSEHGWDIPEFNVIRISVYPEVLPKFTDLQIDKNKFEKRPDPGAIDTFFYTNETDGISLTVDEKDEFVLDIRYFPEAKYNHLRCKAKQEN